MVENEYLERLGYNNDRDEIPDSDAFDSEEEEENIPVKKSAPKMLWQLSVCFLGSQREAENYKYTFQLNQNNEAMEDAKRNGIGKVCTYILQIYFSKIFLLNKTLIPVFIFRYLI